MAVFFKRIQLFILIYCLPGAVICYSQSSTISPYSFYGIGDIQYQNGAQGFAMGQTGIALHNDSITPCFINLKNPASYAYTPVTTYEAGVINNNIWLSTEGQNYTNSNAYFGYFAIAFPIGRHFGASFGLRPMSSLGYNLTTAVNLDSIDSKGNATAINQTTNQYIGNGGINRLHFGLAYSPWWWISLGANVSYLFGNLNYTEDVVYPSAPAAYNSQYTENIYAHGWAPDFGAMITLFKTRDSGFQAIAGATYSLGSSLFADYNLLAVSYVTASPQTNIDTITDSSATGKMKLPTTYGGGLTLIFRDKNGNNQWTFTSDYLIQKWSQYTLFGVEQNLSDSWQWGIGAQYIPKKNSYNNGDFFKRIHYRAGFSVTQTYLTLNNTPIRDVCATLGVSVPVGAAFAAGGQYQLGLLNIGVQLGQLGTTSNNLLSEQYAKVMASFTFNHLWFRKRLYQ